MKNLRSISKENISKNFWSVFGIFPELPSQSFDKLEPHYREAYLSTLRHYSDHGLVKFKFYFNSRQEMYQIFSILLDHNYNHIIVSDPCDETGKDTFRRVNKRVWLNLDDYELEIKDAYDYGEIVSSCRYGIEKYYINLEVNIPISGIKNFISLIDSLGELGYKSIRLAPGIQLGQNNLIFRII